MKDAAYQPPAHTSINNRNMIKTTFCLVIATANTTMSIVKKNAVENLRVGAHILVHCALGPTRKPVAASAINYIYRER